MYIMYICKRNITVNNKKNILLEFYKKSKRLKIKQQLILIYAKYSIQDKKYI